jgi:uncharacterized membrane protein YfcA
MLKKIKVFFAGTSIGTLGGLIGLGGAEFRLPLLLGIFAFPPLEAVILNKAMSLLVVASALPFRAATISWENVFAHWQIIANLLAGSLFGAWLGASWATTLRRETLYRIISTLLVGIAIVLMTGHHTETAGSALFQSPVLLMTTGVIAGLCIGIVAALLGVAGGELLIPTIVILFGADIKLAGSLSLAVSLPTMLVSFARYSRDSSFAVLSANKQFVLIMAAGSVVGAWVGSRLLGIVPDTYLLPMLSAILLISAIKVWKHKK